MKSNKVTLCFLFIFIPLMANAEKFILNCVLQDTREKGVSAAYTINTSKKTVTYDGSNAFDVEITDLKIKFTETQEGTNWTTIISRTDGTMRTYKQNEPTGVYIKSICNKIQSKLF